MKPLLSVENLSVSFERGKNQVLKKVSWQIFPGEVLGIVGESGAGKTISTLAALQLLPSGARLDEGRIVFKERDLLTSPDIHLIRGREIGYVFQEPDRSFDPLYPIGKTLFETLRVSEPDLSKGELESRSITLLEEMKIPHPQERMQNYPHQFSGGMLQRLMLALALAQSPSLLIADEPTTALDVTIQAEIIQLLLAIQKRRGLSIVFISHNIALLSGIAHRIVVMCNGQVVEEGPVEQVIYHPSCAYTRELLSSVLEY